MLNKMPFLLLSLSLVLLSFSHSDQRSLLANAASEIELEWSESDVSWLTQKWSACSVSLAGSSSSWICGGKDGDSTAQQSCSLISIDPWSGSLSSEASNIALKTETVYPRAFRATAPYLCPSMQGTEQGQVSHSRSCWNSLGVVGSGSGYSSEQYCCDFTENRAINKGVRCTDLKMTSQDSRQRQTVSQISQMCGVEWTSPNSGKRYLILTGGHTGYTVRKSIYCFDYSSQSYLSSCATLGLPDSLPSSITRHGCTMVNFGDDSGYGLITFGGDGSSESYSSFITICRFSDSESESEEHNCVRHSDALSTAVSSAKVLSFLNRHPKEEGSSSVWCVSAAVVSGQTSSSTLNGLIEYYDICDDLSVSHIGTAKMPREQGLLEPTLYSRLRTLEDGSQQLGACLIGGLNPSGIASSTAFCTADISGGLLDLSSDEGNDNEDQSSLIADPTFSPTPRPTTKKPTSHPSSGPSVTPTTSPPTASPSASPITPAQPVSELEVEEMSEFSEDMYSGIEYSSLRGVHSQVCVLNSSNHRAYIIGGVSEDNGQSLNSAQYFDTRQTGSDASLKQFDSVRLYVNRVRFIELPSLHCSHQCSHTFGDSIYIVSPRGTGNFRKDELILLKCSVDIRSNALECRDLCSFTTASFCSRRFGFDSCVTADPNDESKMVIAGGNYAFDLIDTVSILDLKTDSWITEDDDGALRLGTGVDRASCSVWNQTLFVFGGSRGTIEAFSKVQSCNLNPITRYYDSSLEEPAECAVLSDEGMRHPRYFSAAVTIGSDIVISCGMNSSKFVPEVEVFDGKSRVFRTMDTVRYLNHGEGAAKCCAMNDGGRQSVLISGGQYCEDGSCNTRGLRVIVGSTYSLNLRSDVNGAKSLAECKTLGISQDTGGLEVYNGEYTRMEGGYSGYFVWFKYDTSGTAGVTYGLYWNKNANPPTLFVGGGSNWLFNLQGILDGSDEVNERQWLSVSGAGLNTLFTLHIECEDSNKNEEDGGRSSSGMSVVMWLVIALIALSVLLCAILIVGFWQHRNNRRGSSKSGSSSHSSNNSSGGRNVRWTATPKDRPSSMPHNSRVVSFSPNQLDEKTELVALSHHSRGLPPPNAEFDDSEADSVSEREVNFSNERMPGERRVMIEEDDSIPTRGHTRIATAELFPSTDL